MYKIRCTYEGIVPMMQDRFFDPASIEKGKGKRKGKDAWKEELPRQAYLDKKGAYIPADNIRMMLLGNKFRRGASEILGSDVETKKGKQYKSICTGCIWVVGEQDPQKIYIEPKRKTFDDYDERSFINAAGSRSLKRRPIFNTPWSITFQIHVTEDTLQQDFVHDLFEVAGMRCGVGAYGPTFGRAVIKTWEVLK